MAGDSEWIQFNIGCSCCGDWEGSPTGTPVLWGGKGQVYHSPQPTERTHHKPSGELLLGIRGVVCLLVCDNIVLSHCMCTHQVICSVEFPDEVSGMLLCWEYLSSSRPANHPYLLSRSASVPVPVANPTADSTYLDLREQCKSFSPPTNF